MLKKTKEFLYQSLLLTAGSTLSAFSVKVLLMHHGLLSQGMTGFALLIYYKWAGLPLSVIYFLINIPVFILGWRFVGRRFILYSIWGMVIYTLSLYINNLELKVENPMLATLIVVAFRAQGRL